MISANPVKPPDDEKSPYSSNQFGIERAAKDLSDSREAEKPAARILLPFYL